MERLMFLLKGDKGLYATDFKRMYFPDRSYSDNLECGIALCEVTREEKNYSFIKGRMVSTMSTKEAISRGILHNEKSIDAEYCINGYNYWLVNDDIFTVADGRVEYVMIYPSLRNKKECKYANNFLSNLYRQSEVLWDKHSMNE